MEAQGAIGWRLIRYGFLAKEWQTAQTLWEKGRDPNYQLRKIQRWVKQVQTFLWEFFMAIWDHRNKVLHGREDQEAVWRKLEKLRGKVRGVLRDSPALGATDRHLLDLCKIDQKNGQYLHHWLRAVRGAARKEQLRRKKEKQNYLMAYLRWVRQRQWNSSNRTYRQATLWPYVVQEDWPGQASRSIEAVNRGTNQTERGRRWDAGRKVTNTLND